jgi:hypothetical protein
MTSVRCQRSTKGQLRVQETVSVKIIDYFCIDPTKIIQSDWSRKKAPLATKPVSDFSGAPDKSSSKDGAPPNKDPPTIYPTMLMKAMDTYVKNRQKKTNQCYYPWLIKKILAIVCLNTCVEILDGQYFLTNAKVRKLTDCSAALVVTMPKYCDSYVNGDAQFHYALYTGLQILNPGGWRDWFENTSGDSACDVDPATCQLVVFTDCTTPLITTKLTNSNGIITVNTV